MAEQASGGVTIKSYSRARRLLDFMKLPAWLLLGLAAIVPLVQMGLGVHPLPATLSAAQYGIIALSVFALVAVGGAIIDIAENVQAVAKQQLGAEEGESD